MGQIDVALLPIGRKFTMDIPEAVEADQAINPKVVIPVHRFDSNPRQFAIEIKTRMDIVVMPLKIGEGYSLGDE